jgi:N-acetyl-gamma-glutamyl-phosphate reductase
MNSLVSVAELDTRPLKECTMESITVGILGATGYTGVELIKLLAKHPHAHLAFVSSQTYAGKKMSEVFPELTRICDRVLLSPEEAIKQAAACVFSCLPHAASAALCKPLIDKGIRVIDLSADFRIRDPKVYTQWYKTEHPCPEFLPKAVFGLPEHYRREIAATSLCANPGCYSSSIMLPLIPLFKEFGDAIGSVIADSKSGVSGAGRSLKLNSLFTEAHENFSAYSLGRTHRHIAEIDQELSLACGKNVAITFSPHLVPLNRGILSTIYLTGPLNAARCLELLRKAYEQEPFIRVRQPSDLPTVRDVAYTNFCDMTITGGDEGQPVIIVSALDNLLKGASGQALQNMNIMFGLEETTALL